MKSLPDPAQRKSDSVRHMFDRIAPSYDLLNHLLSFHIDKFWRSASIKELLPGHCGTILDVATGTGDFAVAALKHHPDITIVGVDFSSSMLHSARSGNKFIRFPYRYFSVQGDAQKLPTKSNFFSAAMIAYGIRNVENIPLALNEVYRSLKSGGRFLILEFSKPENAIVGAVYRFYFHQILPRIGNLISRDKGAYSYLPESVEHFPDAKMFVTMIQEAGFATVKIRRFTFGITTLYIADKG